MILMYELHFLLPGKPLQCRLPGPRLSQCFELLRPDQFYRPADLGVVRTCFGVVVLMQTLLKVVRTAAVEGVVGAEEDVGVVHGNPLYTQQVLLTF